MISPALSPRPAQLAEELVGQLLAARGWKIERQPAGGPRRADLLIRKGRQAFIVEIKAISEGRPDRVIPLLSQAILQVRAYAHGAAARPLAVVCVGEASPSLLDQVKAFSRDFAPDVAVGIVSESGIQYFLGEGLEGLNVEPPLARKRKARSPGHSSHLFSDLNQWMLKVLLAPEIPERLLVAPRAEHRNVSELANAANVSLMSASRFAQQLRDEGFLDESSAHFKLVRRPELFRRWRSAALRSLPEMAMRFLIRGSARAQLREVVSGHQACLGLFAAAEALRLGHVEGVPPYVYVPRLPRSDRDAWKELVPSSPGESIDLILRQAPAPQSVFRGAVQLDGVAVSDVLQIWLDVSAHPSRGEEQADLIRRKVLGKIIESAP